MEVLYGNMSLHYICYVFCMMALWLTDFNPKHAAKPMKENISYVLTDDLPFFSFMQKLEIIFQNTKKFTLPPLLIWFCHLTYLHEFWRRSRVPLRWITCSNFLVRCVDFQIQPISDLDHWFQHQPLAHSLGAFWMTHSANRNSKTTQWGTKVFYLLKLKLQCKPN